MTVRRSGAQNWLSYVGLAAMVIGVVYQSGEQTKRVEFNSDRIAKLEASDAQQSEKIEGNDKAQNAKLDLINQRGARIEAKLDLLFVGGDRKEPKSWEPR